MTRELMLEIETEKQLEREEEGITLPEELDTKPSAGDELEAEQEGD